MPIVLKSGSLNLLEPSGPVQACNGIALPLPLLVISYQDKKKMVAVEVLLLMLRFPHLPEKKPLSCGIFYWWGPANVSIWVACFDSVPLTFILFYFILFFFI